MARRDLGETVLTAIAVLCALLGISIIVLAADDAYGDIAISVAIRPPSTGEHFVATLIGDSEPRTPLLTSECITVAGVCVMKFPLLKLPASGSFCIGPKGQFVGHCEWWLPLAVTSSQPPSKRRAVRH